ncbi:glycerol ethanol, ferric requiring protein [Coelomomyces lativittatus]|nr:glycerol ethanol, ferric requiring protein [Coelomomyces lativittatus]
MNLNVNLNPDLTYPSSSSTTPLTSTTTTKFHFMDTSTLPPSELHDEEGVGSSRAYEEFSTFDWHQGTSSAQRSFHYWGLNLTLLQAWGSVMVIGFLIGVCVAWADVVFEWLYDLKLGRCASFFYLSKKKCCWEQWDEEGSCPDWHEWSYAFFYIRYFPPVNFIIYVLFSSLLASIASYLITSYTPMYGSQSGIAEVKTMLGGFRLHASVVSLKTGWMKWMGLVYAMASGLSIGNKAPLVHIAACWAQGWIHATQSLLRFKKRKNDPEVLHFITCACAAGMAAAFGSPIGGILFTLEEIATFFPIPVMWMAFMCCLCATLMLQILNPFNTGSMVAFQVTRPHEWHLFELMPFAFLGVIGGLTGALFVRWSIRIQLARRRSEFCLKHPILDATYLAFITSFFGYWSALTRDHILSLLAGLFKDCDPNQNYHGICNASPFMNIFSLVYAFLLQFGSSLLTYGAKVPSGIFLPCMAMGACLGRIVGILVSTFQMTFSTSPIFASCQLVDKDCVAPGSYALLGAAAALTGATTEEVQSFLFMSIFM